MLERYSLVLDPSIELLGWHPLSATQCWGGPEVLLATPHVAWAPCQIQPGIDSFGDIYAQMVLFEVKWLGRLQRGITSSQERYSSHLCGIFFPTFVLEYDMHLAMQCSSILYNNYTLWNQGCQMQTVWIVIEVRWYEDATSSCLFINSLCLGCNTSLDSWWRPYSILEWNSRLAPVFVGDVQCNFDVLSCWKARNHSADIVGKVDNLFILYGIDRPMRPSSPTSG